MRKPLLVVFDGNAIVHRAYHAFERTKPLTVTKTGEIVSAVYGFALMLLKTINDLKPTHYAIAFDMRAPTFRHKMYDQYKAQRPETPAELLGQLGRVRQLVEAFNIPIFELEGFEADDVLGALSRQASEQDADVVIVTGDADAMQLVTPRVKVLYPRPRGTFSDTMLYGEAEVTEKYGVTPQQLADYKGLVGDTSDNIPGVRGIGPATATKLLNQFGTIDRIYARIDEVTPARLQAQLRENEAQARQSLTLATIDVRAPVTLKLEECQVRRYERQRVADLFRELEFSSLLARLPEDEASEAKAAAVPARPRAARAYRIVDTVSGLDDLVLRLSAAKSVAFDLETTSLDPMLAEPVGICLSLSPGEADYIPVGHTAAEGVAQLPLETVVSRLRPPLADAALAKIAHNGKYDMTVLAEHGVPVSNLAFDTMIAAHLLGESALSIKALAFGRLGVEMTPITDLIGTGSKQISMAQVGIKPVADYCCADADIAGELAQLLKPDLEKQGLWRLFAEVEMPLVPVLMRMERHGVLLDAGLLRDMSQRLGEQLRQREAEVYSAVGHEFNINSPQQLGPVLALELKLPLPRKRGTVTTEASELEKLREVHPVIGLILDYRQLTKLKSTYIDALPGLINPKTGRVHTSFNQTRTATGRLSSSDPNLQNIPIRGELGKQVRQAFIAAPGSWLLSGDYSQIDLRALAHLSRDESLLRAFHQDEDIHAATAAQLFGVGVGEVTPDMRRLAKVVNFGVIYGMSDYGLEQATELSREQAGKFIAAYFEKHPGVSQYLESTKKQAREQGYVQTLLGRRRPIPEINSHNRVIREAAERMAINMPVQGTSADIIKVAMINLEREMAQRHLQSRMLLQVHDELVFEVPESELAVMRQLVPEVMTSAVLLGVPLKVDVKVGHNWGEMD